jgi:hypothetical protein
MKEIPLNHGFKTLVDDEDYDELMKYKWRAYTTKGLVYVSRTVVLESGKQHSVLMHRMIANTPEGMQTDHINRNPLDNRKCNLRVCDYATNMQNRHKRAGARSKYYGVFYNPPGRKHWTPHIRFNGVVFNLGYFDTEEEAAKAYDTKARELYGEHARINGV